MKVLLLIISTTFLACTPLFASDRAGNGGGAWVCQNTDRLQTIRWAKLVDLYEAEKEFQLEMKSFGNRDYHEIIDAQKVRLFSIDRHLYARLEPYFEEVESNIREVDADLEVIDDSLYRVRPSARDCVDGVVKYVQLANFTNYGAVLINQYLFNNDRLSETSKAALIFHEAIYTYLRDRYHDLTSVRTREIVGLLFSALRNAQISERIDSVLGTTVSTRSLGMEFTTIAAGTFTMGSPTSEPGRFANEEQRQVTLTNSFEMMTTEVTQSMYFEVTGINPSYFKNQEHCPLSFESRTSHTTGQVVTLCPNNPVEQVSFTDVQNFISLLNARTGENYRLPTEAEWEYAARAGTRSAYSFGDSSLLYGYAIFGANSGSKTVRVGPMRNHANNPNNFGLYDMHGNVWEWTQDWYTSSPIGGVNPTGAATGRYRIIRGGSWSNDAGYLRSAVRYSFAPSDCNYVVGFRLVRTLH